MLAAQADGAKVTTIEGLTPDESTHPAADGAVEPPRRPVRVLRAGDGPVAHRSPQPERQARRAGNPPMDGRHSLPLRRLPERRPGRPEPGRIQVIARTRHHGKRRTGHTSPAPRGSGNAPRRIEIHRGRRPAGCGTRRHPAQPHRARQDQEHRHLRRGQDARRDPRLHRRRSRRQDDVPGLHLEARRRREPLPAASLRPAGSADPAGHRQGALPGRVGGRGRGRNPGSGVCGAAGDQGRLRGAAVGDQRGSRARSRGAAAARVGPGQSVHARTYGDKAEDRRGDQERRRHGQVKINIPRQIHQALETRATLASTIRRRKSTRCGRTRRFPMATAS